MPIPASQASPSVKPSMGSTSPRSSPATMSSQRSSIPKRAPTSGCGCTPTLVELLLVAVFTPIPAVDIRSGRCVRLVQGDFFREKSYANDPVEMARYWEAEGAQRLHVVDLDGARDGLRGNAEVIRQLIDSV